LRENGVFQKFSKMCSEIIFFAAAALNLGLNLTGNSPKFPGLTAPCLNLWILNEQARWD